MGPIQYMNTYFTACQTLRQCSIHENYICKFSLQHRSLVITQCQSLFPVKLLNHNISWHIIFMIETWYVLQWILKICLFSDYMNRSKGWHTDLTYPGMVYLSPTPSCVWRVDVVCISSTYSTSFWTKWKNEMKKFGGWKIGQTAMQYWSRECSIRIKRHDNKLVVPQQA